MLQLINWLWRYNWIRLLSAAAHAARGPDGIRLTRSNRLSSHALRGTKDCSGICIHTDLQEPAGLEVLSSIASAVLVYKHIREDKKNMRSD